MIHSAPAGKIHDFVLVARDKAAYLFVTDLAESCYQTFSDHWEVFIAAMSKGPMLREAEEQDTERTF
jgi:hypothetical protein